MPQEDVNPRQHLHTIAVNSLNFYAIQNIECNNFHAVAASGMLSKRFLRS